MYIFNLKKTAVLITISFCILIFTFSILPRPADAATRFGMPPNYLSIDMGLVAYYTFDGADMNWSTGRLFDRTGNGYHGYQINMSTSTVGAVGRIGQSFLFDGINDYVYTPTAPTNSDFSFSVWINMNQGASAQINGNNGILSSCDSNTRFMLRPDNSGDTWTVNGVGFNTFTTGKVDTWTMFTFTRSGTTGTVYKDGVFVASGTVGAGTFSVKCIGIDDPSYGYWMTGVMDDLRMYNRALRADEIWRLYNLGATTKIGKSPTQAVTDGLVGYWTFDGSDVNWATGQVLDKSGQGRHGTIEAMATTTGIEIGKIGQAMNFDGVDDNVYTSAFNIGNATATVMAWTKYSPSSGSLQWVMHQQAGGNRWQLRHGGAYRDDTGWVYAVDPNGSPGLWQHTAVVFAGSYTKIYINGVLDTTGAGGYPVNGNGSIFFGESPGNGFYGGAIDDARIYNRELRPDEIQKIYNLGATTKFGVSPTNALSDGLVGYWTFDGKDVNWATGAVSDKSGQGNNGYLQGLMSTTSSTVIGKIGQALTFDGTDDIIRVADPGTASVLDFSSGSSITIAMWVNSEVFSTYDGFISKGDGSAENYFLQQGETSAQRLAFGYLDTNSNYQLFESSSDVLSLNTWSHVAVTYTFGTGSSARLYVNGEQVAASWIGGDTGNINNYVDNGPLLFARTNGAGEFFQGKIDDIRIYKRSLRGDEIRQLYEMGR